MATGDGQVPALAARARCTPASQMVSMRLSGDSTQASNRRPQDSTSVALLVTERSCASGQAMGNRLLDPEVVTTDDAVLITFAAEPPVPAEQTCQGNPEQPILVELPESLGNRTLRDGLSIGLNLEDFLN